MAAITILEKVCTNCKTLKPVVEFYKNRSKPDGLDGHCRDCCAARRTLKPYTGTETRTASRFFSAGELAAEQWRTVPGFASYKVSTLGRFESTRNSHIGFTRPARILVHKPGPNGYILFELRTDTHRCPRTLHSIVLETFVGPCPEGMEACHKNGIRQDCRLTNLRWDTRKANHEDSVRHGTSNTTGLELGRKAKLFKYTASQLRWVLAHRSEYSKEELSVRSGVHLSTVKRVLQGRYVASTLD